MTKWISVILGTLLLVTNAWWFYATLDQGVTLSHREQLLYEYSNRVLALSQVTNHFVKGKGKEEVLQVLREALPEEEPFEKEGALNTTWVSFQLTKGGTVSSVEQDDLVLQWAKPLGSN